jgi:hypothetical protein
MEGLFTLSAIKTRENYLEVQTPTAAEQENPGPYQMESGIGERGIQWNALQIAVLLPAEE